MEQTVHSILKANLQAMGADGLCGEGCGCSINDLVPCGCDCGGCVPALLVPQWEAESLNYYGDTDCGEIYMPMNIVNEERAKRLKRGNALRQEMERIRDIANGELQVATSDTEGLAVIEEKAQAAIDDYDSEAPNHSGQARAKRVGCSELLGCGKETTCHSQ